MKKSHRFRPFLLLLAAMLFVATGVIADLFGRSEPAYDGLSLLPGLKATVTVYRDEHGVPHIFASGMEDAARTLGYIHADERLFQMEIQRRAGAGRLSELFGPGMLDVDRFTRMLGLYRSARSSFEALSPDTQKLFQAYADGVNYWLKTNQGSMPPEFLLLGLKPERWVPADSLVWAKLMALQLSGNYKQEMLRGKLASLLPPATFEQLFPSLPPDLPVTTQPHLTQHGALQPFNAMPGKFEHYAALDAGKTASGKTFDAFEKLGQLIGLDHAASNEWVVGGEHTESGKPVLANDPHLGLEAPALWYLARVVTPELSLEGATVPGLPIFLLGQNEHIAWGFTTTGSDVQDLFVETVDPDHADHYLAPEGSRPFEMREEIIKVDNEDDVTLKVRSTRHGPVLSDIDPELADLAGKGKVMALAFTALAGQDTTPEALVRLNRATDWDAFTAALMLYQTPPQNVVYADTAGNIGFIAPGLVPVRKKGDGRRPVDGASGDYDWTGMIAAADVPQVYNPPAGFVFNANNAIVAADSKNYYGQDWEEPYRAQRLQQFFDTTAKHSLDTSAAMQGDHVSLVARQLLPHLLRQTFTDARETAALDMLRGWDGTMDRDRAEPLIFEAWLYELHNSLLADKVRDPLKAQGPYDAFAIASILGKDPGAWCSTPDHAVNDCDDVIRKAFTDALLLLTLRDGEDMKAWSWGKEHITVLHHRFYSHLPIFRDYTDLSIASSGDFYTLDRGGSASIDPDRPFARTHGAGFRGLYDLSDPAKSRFMIATGESGHIFSPHYRDLVKPWNDISSFTLAGSQADLAARRLPVLVFAPGAQPKAP